MNFIDKLRKPYSGFGGGGGNSGSGVPKSLERPEIDDVKEELSSSIDRLERETQKQVEKPSSEGGGQIEVTIVIDRCWC